MGLRLKVLYLGATVGSKNDLVKEKDPAVMIKSPHWALLVEHPTLGRILVDTGDSDDWQDRYSDHIKTTYPMTEFIPLGKRLEENGISYGDIDILILTHFHFDHVGGLKYFSGTKAGRNIYVSKPEVSELFARTKSDPEQVGGAYVPSQYDGIPELEFKMIDGDTVLADDFRLFLQKCHTSGLIGYEIRLADGQNIIFCGDTIYTKEAYEESLPPGGSINKSPEEFYSNLDFIKKLKKEENAIIFFGHDYDQVKAWEQEGWIEASSQIV